MTVATLDSDPLHDRARRDPGHAGRDYQCARSASCAALHLARRPGIADHLTAPAVRPRMIKRWPRKIRAAAGMVASTDAAAISPCWIS